MASFHLTTGLLVGAITGHVILKAEVVEQPLRHCLHPHHRPISLANCKKDGITTISAK
jgi:hypothetical protein